MKVTRATEPGLRIKDKGLRREMMRPSQDIGNTRSSRRSVGVVEFWSDAGQILKLESRNRNDEPKGIFNRR